ncbi:transposase [Pseudomonas syringae group genomosp. 3]|uniref:transposase n=1 Tax=Pseudomonas syringae group genomosp. 3 TaxID=251701 RepID=UPI001FBB18BF|nr:transposase [Pseudomonas syringae group genomosp. 3]
MPQERRSYSKSFKAQVIAECAQPDTSIANVALTHNLNANLAHATRTPFLFQVLQGPGHC